jgi:hypothetical protein
MIDYDYQNLQVSSGNFFFRIFNSSKEWVGLALCFNLLFIKIG